MPMVRLLWVMNDKLRMRQEPLQQADETVDVGLVKAASNSSSTQNGLGLT